jgi:hypothetical protein
LIAATAFWIVLMLVGVIIIIAKKNDWPSLLTIK